MTSRDELVPAHESTCTLERGSRAGRWRAGADEGPIIPLFALAAAVVAAFSLVRAIGTENGTVPIVAVDRIVASPLLYEGRYVRVDGEVLPGETIRTDTPCLVRFVLARKGARMAVEHHECIPPDGFHDGTNVVAEGTLAADGHFDAAALIVRDAYPHAH